MNNSYEIVLRTNYIFKMSNANEINEIALMSLEDKKVLKRRVENRQPYLASIVFDKIVLFKKKGKSGTICNLQLHSIESIDGVRCDASIKVSTLYGCMNRTEFVLRMEALMVKGKFNNSHVYYHERFIIEDNNPRAITETFETLIDEIIPNLKFSPLMCKFVDSDELLISKAIDAKLRKTKTSMYSETCGVCFEITRAKTGCNHTLCVSCADKISVLAFQNFNDNENETQEPCCPLCRNQEDFYITF